MRLSNIKKKYTTERNLLLNNTQRTKETKQKNYVSKCVNNYGVDIKDCMNSSAFNVFLNRARDAEEWIASGKLFRNEVAAAEKHLPTMVSAQVRKVTTAVEDKERSR